MGLDLSVLIPTYNRKESLQRTLGGLARQSFPSDRFEAIVVSDGSTDGTAETVRSLSFPYRLRLLEQSNSGPSVARNHAARAACGDLLVFLDDDIEPAPEFLTRHVAAHSEDDNLVLIGPQSMPRGESFPIWILWEHLMLERQYSRFRSGEWQVRGSNLYSGNFSIRRERFVAAGGFDESFKRQEDVELGLRLEARGMRFAFDMEAEGLHRPVRTYRSWYETPYIYGVRDVQMARDKGQEVALDLARRHYKGRNRATRVLARLCVGRRPLDSLLFACLRPAAPSFDRVGLRKPALALCSITFNLRYLQGMAREFGGARRMWEALG